MMLEGPPPTLRQTVAGSRRQHGDKQGSKQAGRTNTFVRHPLVPLSLRLLATFIIRLATIMITVTATTVHDKTTG